LQRARAADAERAVAQQEASVKAAVDNLKTELNVLNTQPPSDDVAKRHAEEMRALEQQLTGKHNEELKAAVEAAVAAAQQDKPMASFSEEDRKAAITAAIVEHEKQLSARHAEEIASAVERGRMEQATKGKLKDSQLVKSQKRVKELETQILEWRKAGILPESSSVAQATPATGSTSTAANPQIAVPADPTTPVAVSVPTGNAGSLPRKPAAMAPMTSTDPANRGGRGGARGIVRGAPRGGLNIRGAAPGRGGAPGGSAPAAASGVTILGAAVKRTREDGETPDDTLAKRLKPVEGTGGPVALRRPPPS
jgi:nucleoprotein TPR